MFGDVVAEVPCHSDQMHQTVRWMWLFLVGFGICIHHIINSLGTRSARPMPETIYLVEFARRTLKIMHPALFSFQSFAPQHGVYANSELGSGKLHLHL